MKKPRPIWFEYSWALGLWIWPITTEGWVVFIGGPALALLLLGTMKLVQALLPGSPLYLIPLGLFFVVAIGVNYLTITRMQRKGELRDEDVNHTARQLFGGQPWRPRRPRPLFPDRPTTDD